MLIIGAISTVASIVMGAASLRDQREANENNINFQTETNRQNIEEQWKMWNATNNYNSYVEQMARARAAGLNPNLVYGQSQTTSPVNVGVAQSPSQTPLDFSMLSNSLPQMLNFMTQASTARKNKFGNDLTSQQIASLSLSNEIEESLKDTNINFRKQEYDNLAKTFDKIEQDIKVGKEQAALYEVEKLAKELNLKYDKTLADHNLPPDVDPTMLAILSILSQLYEKVTNRDADVILDKVFRFGDNSN